MPTTFTRTPVETERKEPGFGGKPPVARRPTGGGGDGENWENRPSGRRGPRDLLARYRMVLFFALASDLMFFIALVSAFFARQSSGHFTASNIWVIDWRPVAVPPILWINTALILLSSLTMEVGRRHFFREIDVMEEWLGLGRPTIRRAAPWLAATVVLGGLFLAGQWVAWRQLALQHVFFKTNQSSHFFYLITGVHAVHLFLGIAGLITAFTGLYVSRQLETRQILVDGAAWYWHAMGLLWLFLFTLLVFFQ